jgi:hypothetical protein
MYFHINNPNWLDNVDTNIYKGKLKKIVYNINYKWSKFFDRLANSFTPFFERHLFLFSPSLSAEKRTFEWRPLFSFNFWRQKISWKKTFFGKWPLHGLPRYLISMTIRKIWGKKGEHLRNSSTVLHVRERSLIYGNVKKLRCLKIVLNVNYLKN